MARPRPRSGPRNPLRRFRGPGLSRTRRGSTVLALSPCAERPVACPRNDRDRPPVVHASAFSASASLSFAALSIAASDLRTWLRSVVYQKSGSDAFR